MHMKDTIMLATGNAGKAKEFRALLAPKTCVLQADLGIESADETGKTFIENAILKARHVSHRANMPAIADDSGLVVPALSGAPGIYSSRFAGAQATDKDNIAKLIDLLKTEDKTAAFFYCAIVMLQHKDDPTPLIGTGILKGEITITPSGTEGFGYDPIFYLPDYQCTLAELPMDEKNKISHRAKALAAIAAQQA